MSVGMIPFSWRTRKGNNMSVYGWLNQVRDVAEEAAREDDARLWGWRATAERPFPFGYRLEHIQQVVRNGEWLSQQYPEADAEVVLAACWLHDVRKYEKKHAERGAAYARSFLPTVGFPRAKVEAVAHAITVHEGYYRPANRALDRLAVLNEPFVAAPPMEPLEAALVWDADKLAKIGPISHLHFFGSMVAAAFRDGKAVTTIKLQRENAEHIKVSIPRTIASFNTEAARQRAIAQDEAYRAYHRAMDDLLT
jgi:uncharacterized protein